MLRELRVGNLALVEDLSLSLDRGLTVLTGATGAGKSLIAGALSLLAGGKADRGTIRRGEDLAFVEGVFDLGERADLAAKVRGLGITLASDGILVLRRELRREGRGRVLINGLVSSQALLERLGEDLLSIQSQDQQRVLARASFAGGFLDRVLGLEPLRAEVGELLAAFNDLAVQLEARTREEEFARQQMEIWEYQLKELQEASLDPGEEERLADQLSLGRNARALLEGAAGARAILTEGESSAQLQLARAISALEPVTSVSPRLESILSLLREAHLSTGEAASDLERFLDAGEVEPAQLDEMEARLSLFSSLKRKYDRDLAGLVELAAELEERVQRQASAASHIQDLKQDLEAARERLAAAAALLHERRLKGAPGVSARARDLIRPLALPDLEISFEITPRFDPSGQVEFAGERCLVNSSGFDKIRLLVRTNRGEGFGEVGKIASGGEKSRIYLALSVLAEGEGEHPLLLFDEIDAGLGMDNGVPVAGLLARLAENGQVLCITHLPTMAAHGRHHLQVSKEVHGGRTVLRVIPLSPEERVAETARLLGGQMSGPDTLESQVDYARKLLAARSWQGSG